VDANGATRTCVRLTPHVLNLPTEKQSHGLRKLAAVESSRGSFDEAVQALARATGQQLGKRQVEELAALAAVDFESFYATPLLAPPGPRTTCWCCRSTAKAS